MPVDNYARLNRIEVNFLAAKGNVRSPLIVAD